MKGKAEFKWVEFNPRGGEKLTLGGELAGRAGHRPEGVVVCHPHPQFGGDMHYPLVEELSAFLAGAGLVTLRFNFRGVGGSQGRYGGGDGEVQDTLGAVDFLRAQKDFPVQEVFLAGYSFGAWVGFQAAAREGLKKAAGVCIPVALFSFDFLKDSKISLLLVHGTRDQFTPIETVRELASGRASPARVEVIAGGDHFLAGREEEVSKIVVRFLVNDD